MLNISKIFVFLVITASVQAGIEYDSSSNTISISGFPADSPCRLERLLRLDNLNGWNKVHYDPATNSYEITANLSIGANDGSNTFFRIGSPDGPGERLVMRGNIFIRPHWVHKENKAPKPRFAPKRHNRLTIGDERASGKRSELVLDGPYSLIAGTFAKEPKRWAYGGELYVINGNIHSAKPENQKNKFKNILIKWGDTLFKNCDIAGFTNFNAYKYWNCKVIFEKARFQNGGCVSFNGRDVTFTRCSFERCGKAFNDYGGLHAKLVDCRFAGNSVNFKIRNLTCLVDCDVSPGKYPDVFTKKVNSRTGKAKYGTMIIQKRVVVKVIGQDRKPISGALVTAEIEQDGIGPVVRTAKKRTNAEGLTPPQNNVKALALCLELCRATDVKKIIETQKFTYTVTAAANGVKSQINKFRPDKDFLTLTLRRK